MGTAADKFVRHTLALSGGKLYHKLSDSDKGVLEPNGAN